MSLKGEIIAYHGWGFDRNCWKKWQEILSYKFQFQIYDRGYFGDDHSPQFKKNSQKIKIIFAHSFGLHLCPLQQLKKSNILVLFNSFTEFHPGDKKQRKRSKYALRLMINEFKNNPKTVLESFYKKSYYPFPSIFPNYDGINWKKLEKDLHLLDTSIVDINILKKIPKIYIINGSKDRIINPSHAQEFSNLSNINFQSFNLEGVGHSLPFTDIKSCVSIINQALGDIESHGTY